MSIKEVISSFLTTNGSGSMTGIFSFLIFEIRSYMLRSVGLIIIISIILGSLVYWREVYINTISVTSLVILYGILVYCFLHQVHKFLLFGIYLNTVQNYYSDYKTIIDSRQDEYFKLMKVTYIVETLVRVLSSKTQTTTRTFLSTVLDRDKTDLKNILA